MAKGRKREPGLAASIKKQLVSTRKELIKKVRKAERDLKSFGHKVKPYAKKLAKSAALGALGTLAGGALGSYAVGQAMDYI